MQPCHGSSNPPPFNPSPLSPSHGSPSVRPILARLAWPSPPRHHHRHCEALLFGGLLPPPALPLSLGGRSSRMGQARSTRAGTAGPSTSTAPGARGWEGVGSCGGKEPRGGLPLNVKKGLGGSCWDWLLVASLVFLFPQQPCDPPRLCMDTFELELCSFLCSFIFVFLSFFWISLSFSSFSFSLSLFFFFFLFLF